MRKRNLLLIVAVIAISYMSCERDDICPESTPTTPRLIIDLLDSANPENKKKVFKLVAIGEGVENNLVLPGHDLEDLDVLSLPLKTTEDSTQYTLINDAEINDNGTPDDSSDDFLDGNFDTLTINYTREQVYVSRACGYKTIFKNITLVLDETDTDPWILSTESLTENQTAEDETTAHFNIFH